MTCLVFQGRVSDTSLMKGACLRGLQVTSSSPSVPTILLLKLSHHLCG